MQTTPHLLMTGWWLDKDRRNVVAVALALLLRNANVLILIMLLVKIAFKMTPLCYK